VGPVSYVMRARLDLAEHQPSKGMGYYIAVISVSLASLHNSFPRANPLGLNRSDGRVMQSRIDPFRSADAAPGMKAAWRLSAGHAIGMLTDTRDLSGQRGAFRDRARSRQPHQNVGSAYGVWDGRRS
jgi:hypothetical protein